jgi:WD40 repeat protein
VLAIALSGELVATTGQDSRARVFRLRDGSPVAELPNVDPNCGAVAFSPDGSRIALDRAVCDPRSGKVRCWFRDGAHSTRHLAWSPDGKRILASGLLRRWRGMPIYDAETGRTLLRVPLVKNRSLLLFWSDDGKKIVGRDNGLEITFSAATASELSRRELTWRRPSTVIWSPSGSRALYGDGAIVDLEADEVCRRLPGFAAATVTALAWSPDGERVAVGLREGRIRIYVTP